MQAEVLTEGLQQDRVVSATKMSTVHAFLLALVLLAGFGIRLYGLKNQPLDFFAPRQLRSLLIARAVYYKLSPTANPALRQKAIDLANLEVYEPPILEQLVGITYVIIGSEQFWLARIYQALFWSIGGLAIFGIGRRITSFFPALAGLSFYLFLPFGIIASRSFQPDPWMVMWILVTAYALFRWSESPNWKWAILTGVLGGMAVLVKIYAVFFVAPMIVAVWLSAQGFRRTLRNPHSYVMTLLVAVPSIIYYLILNQARSSDFLSFWTLSLASLILTHKFYAEWMSMIGGIMGLTVLLAGMLGTFLAPKNARALMIGGWIGYLLFGLSSPYQYTTHDYYHLTLIGLVGLSLVPFMAAVFQVLAKQAWIWRAMAVAVLVYTAGYSLWVARSNIYISTYADEPASWRNVAKALPEGKTFVSLTADYDMRLRYYGWRASAFTWPSSADLKLFSIHGNQPIDYDTYFKENTNGRDYFLVTALSEFDAQPQLKTILTEGYPVYYKGNGFVIYDLDHPLTK
ncbi:MAG TPA: glycosyltransferase family 39 protein [Anaerolineaceae bacterium]|nr:glycosyltransferase family 39 protein [Anaerolineaceae bacterium]